MQRYCLIMCRSLTYTKDYRKAMSRHTLPEHDSFQLHYIAIKDSIDPFS